MSKPTKFYGIGVSDTKDIQVNTVEIKPDTSEYISLDSSSDISIQPVQESVILPDSSTTYRRSSRTITIITVLTKTPWFNLDRYNRKPLKQNKTFELTLGFLTNAVTPTNEKEKRKAIIPGFGCLGSQSGAFLFFLSANPPVRFVDTNRVKKILGATARRD